MAQDIVDAKQIPVGTVIIREGATRWIVVSAFKRAEGATLEEAVEAFLL